jgi:hypothetical protein
MMAFAPAGKTLALGCRNRKKVGLREEVILTFSSREAFPNGTAELLMREKAKRGR